MNSMVSLVSSIGKVCVGLQFSIKIKGNIHEIGPQRMGQMLGTWNAETCKWMGAQINESEHPRS